MEERFYLAELRRRRGDALARLGRRDQGRTELLAALALAREQGAGGLQRRIARTLLAHALEETPAALQQIHEIE